MKLIEQEAKVTPINPFTPRQADVLGFMIQGYTIGIFGVVEAIVGERPRSRTDLLFRLAGDVVLNLNFPEEKLVD